MPLLAGVPSVEGSASVPPTVGISVPGDDPADPREPITVVYDSMSASAGSYLSISCYANNISYGTGKLVFAGDPSDLTPDGAAPTVDFEIVSNSDDGVAGSIEIQPKANRYWSGPLCFWEVIYTVGDVSDRTTGTANIDTSMVPPSDDSNPPQISNQEPPPNSDIAYNQPVYVDVTDDVGVGIVFMYVTFEDNDVEEVVYNGAGFSPFYAGASKRTAIAGGYRFMLIRFGGWPSNPTFTLRPVDTSGNQP